jgi:hypothetical protein
MHSAVLRTLSFGAMALLYLSSSQAIADSMPVVISGVVAKHKFKHLLQNGPDQTIKKPSRSFTTGWNFFTCKTVVWAKEGKYNNVYIVNDDDSAIVFGTTGNSPTIQQEIMMRSCLRRGDEYGVYVTNVSKGTWSSIAGK